MSGVEVVVGRLVKAHGLRGDIGVDVRTDTPELRFTVGAHLRGERGRDTPATDDVVADLELTAVRWHSGRLLVRVAGFEDRTAAETLRGTLLHVVLDSDDTPDDPDEYYDHQLVGLAVEDVDGTPLGVLARVVHGGAQDLLEVRTPSGRTGLVPFVSALVPEVDLDGRRVVVADRPGLVTPFADDTSDPAP